MIQSRTESHASAACLFPTLGFLQADLRYLRLVSDLLQSTLIIMDFLNGITILLIYELVGEACKHFLNLPIPGPVLGMMFLFLTLIWRGRIHKSLNLASEALLSHLSLLFIPAGVGVMLHVELILRELVPISLTLLLSTAVTMTVTAVVMLITQRFLSRRGRKNA